MQYYQNELRQMARFPPFLPLRVQSAEKPLDQPNAGIKIARHHCHTDSSTLIEKTSNTATVKVKRKKNVCHRHAAQYAEWVHLLVVLARSSVER